ncbi:hypothetical protein MHBO_000361 [Bonamia ostreae]|uniref:SAM domain-containing protein n=1 Tax=Bonamia ostreae TaxID=126728 RepID=A0ABV2AFC1_9EUKA
MATTQQQTTDSRPVQTFWHPLPQSFWGRNRIAAWLLLSDFASPHAHTFHENGIDYAAFVKLDENALVALKVHSSLCRTKLSRIIAQVRNLPPTKPRLARKNSAPMWTKENVLDWLDSLSFGWRFIPRFQQLAIDGKKLVRLGPKSLAILIGVDSRPLAKRYVLAINSLSKSGNWRHIVDTDFDIELSSPDASLGFFSTAYVVSAGLKSAGAKLNEAFFPFNMKQINLAMFTYKDAFLRKKKRNSMEAKEVALWLRHMGYENEVVETFRRNGVDGVQLFDLEEEDIRGELGIRDPQNCLRLLCDINFLREEMGKLFNISTLLRLYKENYKKILKKQRAKHSQQIAIYKESAFETMKEFEPFLDILGLSKTYPDTFPDKHGAKENRRRRSTRRSTAPKKRGNEFHQSNESGSTEENQIAKNEHFFRNILKKNAFRKNTNRSLFKDAFVREWVSKNEISRVYKDCFASFTEKDLLESTEDQLSKRCGLPPTEMREVMAAVDQFRIENFRRRLKDSASKPNEFPKRTTKNSARNRNFAAEEAFYPSKNGGFGKPVKNDRYNALKTPLPFYHADEFRAGARSSSANIPNAARSGFRNMAQKRFKRMGTETKRLSDFLAVQRKDKTNGSANGAVASRSSEKNFARSPEIAKWNPRAQSLKSEEKVPPPPPNDPRPPFDVGKWSNSHVFSYLKNISELRPFLQSLRNLNGRSLLDIAGRKSFGAQKNFDLKCLSVLKGVSKALSYRDLQNTAVETWTPSNVQSWFEIDTDLPKYGELFRQKNISGRLLVQLTHEMLLGDLGINLAERERILVSVQKLISKAKPQINLPQTGSNNEHNLLPLSMWTRNEVQSWLLSLKNFGKLYLENFAKKAANGNNLMFVTDATLAEEYLVPIAIHRRQMLQSLNNYKTAPETTEENCKTDQSYPIRSLESFSESFEDYDMHFPLSKRKPMRRFGAKTPAKTPSTNDENDQKNVKENTNPNEILIECSFCRKRFENTDLLISHLSIHEKSCSICAESFGTNEQLDKHMAVHFKKDTKLNEFIFGNSSEMSENRLSKNKLVDNLFGEKKNDQVVQESDVGELKI